MTNFYHFTSTVHLPVILEAGLLKLTESNVDALIPHAGPDVVWLLDVPQIDHHHGLEGSAVDKTEVMFTVDVPAINWLDWTWGASMDPRDRSRFIEVAGGMEAAEHWYVWPAPIPRRRWLSVTSAGKKVEL